MVVNDFKILIVEDNLTYAIQLEVMLFNLGNFVCLRTDNSIDALRLISQEKPHLILMDIDIKGALSGIEIGHKIKDFKIPILYISSFGNEENYQLATDSNMIGFLVKPINEISLRSSIDLAISKAYNIKKDIEAGTTLNLKEEIVTKDAFYFTKKNTIHKVPVSDITYVKADNIYTETTTVKNERFLSRTSLTKMEEILPVKTFVRIHRKYIVQVSKITKVNADFKTVFVGDAELQVSKNNRTALKKMMNVV